MTTAQNKLGKVEYHYRIENRLYIIRCTSKGFTTTFIKVGA